VFYDADKIEKASLIAYQLQQKSGTDLKLWNRKTRSILFSNLATVARALPAFSTLYIPSSMIPSLTWVLPTLECIEW
jgi:hypothetical protein